MTLLLAGHDTTANGLTWTFYLLAQHAEVMADLQEQLRDPPNGVDPSEVLLVEQVVKESMRMFPPVFLFGREAICELDIGDYKIKKGDSVVMSQWIVHRDEQFYSRPTEFQPERWTAEFERTLPKFAYFPFGGGPRACIGKEVAMQEAKGALATLAGEFAVELEAPDEVVPWPTVTLRPRSAVWAKVTPQGQPASGISDDLDAAGQADKAG